MKQLTLALLFALAFTGCKKKEGCTDRTAINYNADADKNCCCQYNGSVVFWNQTGTGFCNVHVKLSNGSAADITADYNTTPSCGNAGCATIEAKDGVYSFYATEQDCDGDGHWATWSGTVVITGKQCKTLLLN